MSQLYLWQRCLSPLDRLSTLDNTFRTTRNITNKIRTNIHKENLPPDILVFLSYPPLLLLLFFFSFSSTS